MDERSQPERGAESRDDANDPETWLGEVDLGVTGTDRERRLYARYVRALALLCECAPYVDDDDYRDLIDEVLGDACRRYPLALQCDGDYRAIAPRASSIAAIRAEPTTASAKSTNSAALDGG